MTRSLPLTVVVEAQREEIESLKQKLAEAEAERDAALEFVTRSGEALWARVDASTKEAGAWREMYQSAENGHANTRGKLDAAESALATERAEHERTRAELIRAYESIDSLRRVALTAEQFDSLLYAALGESGPGSVDYDNLEALNRHVESIREERDNLALEISQANATVGDSEALGRLVREVWVTWAREQPSLKPSWLVPWEGLSDPDRDVDRRIGTVLAGRGALAWFHHERETKAKLDALRSHYDAALAARDVATAATERLTRELAEAREVIAEIASTLIPANKVGAHDCHYSDGSDVVSAARRRVADREKQENDKP